MGCAAGGPRGEYACTAEMIFRDLLFFVGRKRGSVVCYIRYAKAALKACGLKLFPFQLMAEE